MKTKQYKPPTAADMAAYFQGNEDTDFQARMIRECGQSVKTYPFERVVTNPYLLACHHRFCPSCQRRRAHNWASTLRAVIDEASPATQDSDIRRGPHWIAITLPGVPCAASKLGNLCRTLLSYISIASNQQFWRFGIKVALGIMRLEVTQTADQEHRVTPSFTFFVNVSRDMFNAQAQGRLLQRAAHDWIQPTDRENWPGVKSCVIPTSTKRDRDILKRNVSRMIETAYPYPDAPLFLDIVEQMKGVNTVVLDRSQGTPFRPSHVAQADDLRCEAEYSISRVGEDLQESLGRSRGDELLAWP